MITAVKLSAECFIRVSYPSPDPPAHPQLLPAVVISSLDSPKAQVRVGSRS